MNRFEPTDEQAAGWKEWVERRPECIRKVIEDVGIKPWTLYKLKTTRQRVCVQSFSEPGFGFDSVTCTVAVLGEYNLVTHERSVFGIDPYDLEECDLPKECDPVGNLDIPFDVLKGMLDRKL